MTDVPDWAIEWANKLWVDSLLSEAQEICAALFPDNARLYLEGSLNDGTPMKIALAALRRGLELARTKSEAGE